MNPQSEQEKFLSDLTPQEQDPFAQQEGQPEAEAPTAEEKEKDDSEFRNRRERRLASKLQAERESSIALAARLEALTESQKARAVEGSSDYVRSIERLYGTDSPESREATEILKNALASVQKEATDKALEILRQEQREAQNAVETEEKQIDSMLEELEDEYNIDLTSSQSEATRSGFLKLLERMSPKDSDGNITQYADHHAVFEEMRSRNTKQPDNRAKNFASRSMVSSGASKESQIENDSTAQFLRENNII